jgi:ribosomal protein S11
MKIASKILQPKLKFNVRKVQPKVKETAFEYMENEIKKIKERIHKMNAFMEKRKKVIPFEKLSLKKKKIFTRDLRRRAVLKYNRLFLISVKGFPYLIVVSKRAYFWRKKFKIKRPIKRMSKLKRRSQKKYPGLKSAKIFMKLKRLNTFLACATTKKTISTTSTGTLDFSGKKKGSPFARESVARKFLRKLKEKNYRIFDIYFTSLIGRFYRQIMKSFVKGKAIIRLIYMKKYHSHGTVRPKKAKRL